jgi:PRC-barrel domain protein
MSIPMIAGVQTIGANQEEVKILAVGWSAKKNIFGKAVYNDNKEKIGTIDDIIISPDHTVSFAIIGVGGFLGIGKHDVAISYEPIRNGPGPFHFAWRNRGSAQGTSAI